MIRALALRRAASDAWSIGLARTELPSLLIPARSASTVVCLSLCGKLRLRSPLVIGIGRRTCLEAHAKPSFLVKSEGNKGRRGGPVGVDDRIVSLAPCTVNNRLGVGEHGGRGGTRRIAEKEQKTIVCSARRAAVFFLLLRPLTSLPCCLPSCRQSSPSENTPV